MPGGSVYGGSVCQGPSGAQRTLGSLGLETTEDSGEGDLDSACVAIVWSCCDVSAMALVMDVILMSSEKQVTQSEILTRGCDKQTKCNPSCGCVSGAVRCGDQAMQYLLVRTGVRDSVFHHTVTTQRIMKRDVLENDDVLLSGQEP